jgi:membrane associated rhomboid family serine protease
MNFSILWEHLGDPEYVHVLINPLPVYGLSIAVVALVLALFLRTRRLTIAALVLVFICSISAWPTYRYGQAGYDRVKSMADDAGGKWLDEHRARAEKLIWAFLVVATVAALGVISVARWPRTSSAVTIVTLILSGTTLGVGGYIGYAGGHVRHREFRFEPPPEEHEEAEHTLEKGKQ